MARWSHELAASAIVLAAAAAYHNSFSGPFIFDDSSAITDNPTIRHFGSAWFPPIDSTAGGRPALNLTFALNYALNGTGVSGYHAVNLLVHILAGLVLFGVVRRTLLQPLLSSRFGTAATPLAFSVALLWVMHPLQTESVTYIVQRAESLMGLFYLLTLYCFIRGADERRQASGIRRQELESGSRLPVLRSPQPVERGEEGSAQDSRISPLASNLWPLASICCCFLGMATKEVMVSAPLIVLLHDRTFVAGTFRKAWKTRWPFYLALAGTWIPLGLLVAGTHGRAGSAGFATHISWWSYALAQFRAIVHYLRLSLWPDPLLLYYGTSTAARPAEIIPYAVIVLLLVGGTAVALWRRPAIGFLGCWFFAILAPSSSIVPIATQVMAEHRMYLPLIPLIVLAVVGLYRLLGQRSVVIILAIAAGLGCLTARRNYDYRSELAIWRDTVAKCPNNEQALYNLAGVLSTLPDRTAEAISAYEAALRIDPNYAEAHNNLGTALLNLPGRLPDAIAHYESAVRLKPAYTEAHYNLGNALLKMPGRLPDAVAEYEVALRLDPKSAEIRVNLGEALLKMPGRISDAIAQFEAALQIDPNLTEAHNDLGNALFNLPGRLPGAIAQYEAALRLNPNSVSAHYNLGMALLNLPGRTSDAISQFKAALRLKPDLAPARQMLDQLQNSNTLKQ
jgi:tetratricopeptide (TPR) repeat protein